MTTRRDRTGLTRHGTTAVFRAGGAAVVLAALAGPAAAATYTETFETAPGGTGYAALLTSPNGVAYDMYDGRAFGRLAGQTIVVGTGDEGFYWGNNSLLPGPRYGLSGTTYSTNSTNFLLNGYGTGTTGYKLGIDFTHGPTVVDSIGFGGANGSNAPTATVTVHGLRDGVEQWQQTTSVGGNVTLTTGSQAVDRIEIDRVKNTEPLFGAIDVGWYTLDNLTYEIGETPTGGYTWRYYTQAEYLAGLGGAPEPATWAMLIVGFGFVGTSLRRRAAATLAVG